jgi:signal transduction histidine kinase
VFAAVAAEVGLLLGVESVSIERCDPDGGCTVVAVWGKLREIVEVGSRWRLETDTDTGPVQPTGPAEGSEGYEYAWRPVKAGPRELGLRSTLASPVFVSGQVWGAIFAASSETAPMPADAESRIAQFTELMVTAIANAQTRSDLAASRSRIVAAADDERRRVVRDLHDGAHQRLGHTIVTLKLARGALERDRGDAADLVHEALHHAQAANDELRELAHGILPSVLTHAGLGAAIGGLASRMAIPVDVDVSVDRLEQEVEATAYFIVAEALADAARHSSATWAKVTARIDGRALKVEISDDGVGGDPRDPLDGRGMVGVRDRLAVLGGSLEVESSPPSGTVIAASIPVG